MDNFDYTLTKGRLSQKMKTLFLFTLRIMAIILVFSVFACTPALERNEFIAWVEDTRHGLHQVRQKGEWIFDIQYLPLEYRKVKLGFSADSSYIDEEYMFFLVKISSAIPNRDWLRDGLTSAEAQSLQYYFSYTFPNDIQLEEDGVIHNCEIFHFEKSPQPGHPHIFHVGFNVRQVKKNTWSIIFNSDFFGSFPLRFRFSPEAMPKLMIR